MSKRVLKWGETPFDNLTREELLLEVRRMYSAIESATSTLRMSRLADTLSPYWSEKGSGGRTLAKLEFITNKVEAEFEDIYGAFYRYADDLLFPGVPSAGFNWQVCDDCGTMLGDIPSNNSTNSTCLCKKEMRPLTWKDLEPK